MKDCMENYAIEAKGVTPAIRLIVWGFWGRIRQKRKKRGIGYTWWLGVRPQSPFTLNQDTPSVGCRVNRLVRRPDVGTLPEQVLDLRTNHEAHPTGHEDIEATSSAVSREVGQL